MPVPMPMVSQDLKKPCCTSFQLCWPGEWSSAIDDAIRTTWHWCQWCQWPERSCFIHFNYLDVRNAVVPLTMPLASWDIDDSANSITLPKKSCCTSFYHLHLISGVVPFIVPLGSYDENTGTNGITWAEKSYCISFWSSWPKECSVTIDGVISTTLNYVKLY